MSTNNKTNTPKDTIPSLKARVQELEKQVLDYKNRLDELRKAKNNFIIKKEKEYIATGPKEYTSNKVTKSGSIDDGTPTAIPEYIPPPPPPVIDQTKLKCEDCEREKAKRIELEKIVQTLSSELDESKNLVAALKMDNEEARTDFERRKKIFQAELSDACFKEEKAKKEVKSWEEMYKEWMKTMEVRVNELMQTNAFLQKMLEDQDPNKQAVLASQPGVSRKPK